MLNTDIPDVIESTLADFVHAVRENAAGPTPATEKARAETLRMLRGAIAGQLTAAREDGGRIAMGYAPID